MERDDNYLIRKEHFISEFEKYFHFELLMNNLDIDHNKYLIVGKYDKYEICCNVNKEWTLFDNDNKEWIEFEPIELPTEIYERDRLILQNQLFLNDIDKIFKDLGASNDFILDLYELTDILNNYVRKEHIKTYNDNSIESIDIYNIDILGFDKATNDVLEKYCERNKKDYEKE